MTPRPSPEPDTKRCTNCGHAKHLHQGNGGMLNRKGCGAVGCDCGSFSG